MPKRRTRRFRPHMLGAPYGRELYRAMVHLGSIQGEESSRRVGEAKDKADSASLSLVSFCDKQDKRGVVVKFKYRWTDAEVGQVMGLWGDGDSIECIAEKVNRSPSAVAFKVLSNKHAKAYQILWVLKRQGGVDRPIVKIEEIIEFLEKEEKGGAARCVNSG